MMLCVWLQTAGEGPARSRPAAGEGVLLLSGRDAAAVPVPAHGGQTADRGRAQGKQAATPKNVLNI